MSANNINPSRLRDFAKSQIVFGQSSSDMLEEPLQLKKKALSLGMETDITPKEVRKTRQERPNFEAQAHYKSLLDNDRLVTPVESRKKYERRTEEPDGGLVIGDQSNPSELRIRKHLKERELKQMLDADLATNVTLKSYRKLIREDVPSILRDVPNQPESVETTPSSEFSALNLSDSIQRYLSSPVKVAHEKSRREKRGDEEISFFIGKDELDMKSKSRALKEQFLKQLDADNEYLKKLKPIIPRRVNATSQHDVFVDRTGWTGFNIGGSDTSDKRSSQQEYARYLTDQIRSRAEREAEDRLRDSLIPAFENKVPYMSSGGL